MLSVEEKRNLDKLRSYSTVFSSTSFSRLLQEDDYSFINSKIERYDSEMIGNKIITYYDYIKHIYNKMNKGYKNEYIYKNTFINQMLLKKYGTRDTTVINEFRIGNSIADIVMFNGTSKAFEIKTELDSNRRLNTQLSDYRKIFKECYIITHESLSKKYLSEFDDIGVIELSERPNSIAMREVRKPIKNNCIDSDMLMRTIKTSEYKNIVKKHYGSLPKMNSFDMFEICKDLIKKIPQAQLTFLFIEELKNRKSNTEIVNTFYNELRHLCLSMNLDESSYKKLDLKLKQRINL